MADEELRRLQREAEEDPAQRGRYLAEALRRGALSRVQLAQAAYLGDAAATQVLGLDQPGEAAPPAGLSDLARGLATDWEREVVVRAGYAVGLSLISQAQREVPAAGEVLVAGLEQTQAWLDDHDRLPPAPDEGCLGLDRSHAVRACWRVPGLPRDPLALLPLLLEAAEACYRAAPFAERSRAHGADEVRRRVCRELVPWVFGEDAGA
jgi:hypothetical protein